MGLDNSKKGGWEDLESEASVVTTPVVEIVEVDEDEVSTEIIPT